MDFRRGCFLLVQFGFFINVFLLFLLNLGFLHNRFLTLDLLQLFHLSLCFQNWTSHHVSFGKLWSHSSPKYNHFYELSKIQSFLHPRARRDNFARRGKISAPRVRARAGRARARHSSRGSYLWDILMLPRPLTCERTCFFHFIAMLVTDC